MFKRYEENPYLNEENQKDNDTTTKNKNNYGCLFTVLTFILFLMLLQYGKFTARQVGRMEGRLEATKAAMLEADNRVICERIRTAEAEEKLRVQRLCSETRTDYLLIRQECAGVLGDSPSINNDPWRVSNWDKNLKKLRIELGDHNFQYNQ